MKRWIFLVVCSFLGLLIFGQIIHLITSLPLGECVGLLSSAGFVAWMLESKLDVGHK